MFSYIDPTVRERLVSQGKMFRIDREGQRLPDDAPTGSGQTISILGPIPLPLDVGERQVSVQWYACVRNTELTRIHQLADKLRAQKAQESFAGLASSMAVNSVLVVGKAAEWKEPLVRVHSSCLTGDVFGSGRCECGPQLQAALERIDDDNEGGLVVYMSGHEGRGIGLWAKAATYLLQDAGEDTYQANRSLGLPDDSRDFGDAASLLKHFVGGKPFRLLTNNPKKVHDLNAFGLADITPVKHVCGVGENNRRYMQAKRNWGHEIDSEDLATGDLPTDDLVTDDPATGDLPTDDPATNNP
ncbi:MAG: GTP cyclohydrolase II [Proteobacteria bacterium]|nr:GTP cyclohydrolase II [Pseudomonadota bacterium]